MAVNKYEHTSQYRAPSQLSVLERPISRASTAVSAHTTLNFPGMSNNGKRHVQLMDPCPQRILASSGAICVSWGMPGSSNLFAYGTTSSLNVVKIIVSSSNFNEQEVCSKSDADLEDLGNTVSLSFEEICAFELPSPCLKIAWSPSTAACDNDDLSASLKIACACGDGIIRLFRGFDPDIQLFGHGDFINDINFDYQICGEEHKLWECLASASDDCTFRLWNCENGDCRTFHTESECITVRFHPQRKNWLLISTNNGISLFNTETEEYFVQLSLPAPNLYGIDWCFADFERICAISDSRFWLWRLTLGKPVILPHIKGEKGGRIIKYSPTCDMFAVAATNSTTVRTNAFNRQGYPVYIYKTQYPHHPILALIAPESQRIQDMGWSIVDNHIILSISSNQSIFFWKIQ